MFLVELVMQGVRRFKGLSRLRFQGGFNFVAAGNETGKTTAVDAILRLLYPNGDPSSFASFVSRHAPAASRGALVVYSDDGSYYRVIQDFSKRGVNLAKYNAAAKEFALVHKDWDGAAQFMAGMTAGIPEREFGSLFVFRQEHFRHAFSGDPAPARPARQSAPQAARRTPAGRFPEKEARIAELRQALQRAEDAADAEYRAQSARQKLQEISRKIDALQEMEAQFAESETKLAEYKGCENLPGNLSQLIEEQERGIAQARTAIDQINQDIAGIQSQAAGVQTPNIVADPLFILGAVIGAGSVVAALFFLTTEQAAFFPVGVLAALALIAGAWYKSSRKNAERRVLEGEARVLEKQRKDVERQKEKANAPLAAYYKATGTSTPADLKELAENYRYHRSRRDDIAEQRERVLSSTPVETLQEEQNKQQEELAGLEEAARAVAQYNVDTYSIRQDIERIQQEMAAGAPSGAAWDFGAGAGEAAAGFGTSAEAAPSGAGFLAELEAASRIGGIEMDILLPAVATACQRNLSTVTNGAYLRVDLSPGSGIAVHGKDNTRSDIADLSHSTAEAVYFCLRAGLVEALAGKLRLPFVLDDPLTGLDPARQRAACQVLRSLGSKTQVILFSSNAALKAQGDPAVELA